MGDTDRGELIVLQQELEWVLNEEVPRVFNLIMQVLKDINMKAAKHQHQLHRTSVTPDAPWRIQQIQDAANFLQMAMQFLQGLGVKASLRTSSETLNILSQLIKLLQKGRSSLLIPRKKTIDDLLSSRNMKSLTPPLPGDIAISFYLQAHKLVLAVYHLSSTSGTMKFESVQAECSMPWLTPVLVCFTTALHLAHQLRDKIAVFSQFKDFTPDSCSVSTVSC